MDNKKVILITGTRKGIGFYLAKYYSKNGYMVIGCSRGNFEHQMENYNHYIVDVKDEIQVSKLIKTIFKVYGRLDIIVNNAGIASMNHVLLTPTQTVKNILDTNFIGTFNVCREASKLMTRQRYGRIVNFATVAVPLKIDGEAVYAASKSAVITFSQILAKELAQYNITCNVIGPSPIETDLIAAVPKDKLDKLVQSMSIKRFCKFEDISNVIDFFIKDESNYITGQTLYLGGV